MFSVFCLKNEQRQQGPPLPGLEAESSLGTRKHTGHSVFKFLDSLPDQKIHYVPFKIEGKSR